MITKAEFEKLVEAEAKATPGPWSWRPEPETNDPSRGFLWSESKQWCLLEGGTTGYMNDMESIAAFRSALPGLIELIEAWEAAFSQIGNDPISFDERHGTNDGTRWRKCQEIARALLAEWEGRAGGSG